MVKKVLIGFVIGVVTGLFGVAAHAGFVDLPVLGLLFAIVLVAAGGWFTIEWFDTFGWLSYLFAILVVTLLLLLVSHSPDILIVPNNKWVSEVYVVLAPLAGAIPSVFVTRADKKNAEE